MGINMGVYIGLVCLLLTCQKAFSAKIDYGTTLSAVPKTVTPWITKQLVFTCTSINTSQSFFEELYSIAIVSLEETGNTTDDVILAKIEPSGPWKNPDGVFWDETLTGAIYRHPADKTRDQTSGTGYLRLSISYPTAEQILSSPKTRNTVCVVSGRVATERVNEQRSSQVNIIDHTFKSLGGDLRALPTHIKPLLSEKLIVKCNIDGVEAVKTIKEISLVKDGVVVATKTRGHSISTNTSNFPNATFDERLQGRHGYLIATVNYPMKVHSGDFECIVKVANQEDNELEATSDVVEVNATDTTFKNLVKRVHGLSLEEIRLAAHDTNQDSDIHTLKIDTGSNTNAISALDEHDNTQDTNIQINGGNINTLQGRINGLDEHDNTQDTKIQNNGGNINTLQGRVNGLDEHDNTQDTKIQNNGGYINTLQNRINARCGGAYTRLKHGICYAYVQEYKTWEDAQSHCYSIGGYLAEPRNDQQNDDVYFSIPSEGWIWLGGSNNIGGSVNKWRWSTSGDNNQAGFQDFTSWQSGEPNNSGGNEHCLQMPGNDWRWNDVPCSLTAKFVCQRHMNYIHN